MATVSTSFHFKTTVTPSTSWRCFLRSDKLTVVSSSGWNKNSTLHFARLSSLRLPSFSLRTPTTSHPRRKASSARASNADPPENTKSKTTTATGRPPVATIVAGLIVFLLFCLIAGSVVSWLLSLIIHPPSS